MTLSCKEVWDPTQGVLRPPGLVKPHFLVTSWKLQFLEFLDTPNLRCIVVSPKFPTDAHHWTLIDNPVWLALILFRSLAHMDVCWRTMPLLVQRPAVSSPEAPPGISVRTFFEEQLALAPVACVPKNHGFSGDPTNICPFLDTISYFPIFSVDKTCTIVAKFQACCPPTTLVRK